MTIPAEHSLTVATVGTKGQIVIPMEVREKLGIGPGSKVVVLMKDKNVAMLCPMDGMRAWLDKITADFDELSHTAPKSEGAK